jgi:hypothetical protein
VGVGEGHFEQNAFGFQKLRTGANKRLEREENSMVTKGLPTPGLTQIPRLRKQMQSPWGEEWVGRGHAWETASRNHQPPSGSPIAQEPALWEQ